MTVRKAPVSVFAMVAGLVALLACASVEMRLSDRGLPAPDRREYVAQNGYGVSKEVQQAFVEGRVVEDMSREMVLQMFGSPDRTSAGGLLWEYVGPRGRDIVSVHFNNDRVVRLEGDALGRIRKGK